MKRWGTQKRNGFTIVELVVVIVIIAILATITTVVYDNVRQQSQDAERITDMKNITEALEIYRNSKKQLPNEQGSSWEQSFNYPDTFINELKTSGLVSEVPVDPINDARHHYRYYLYSSGYGCDSSKGPFYVLQVINRDKESTDKPENNPGFSCPSRNWTNEAWYTTGGFLYE